VTLATLGLRFVVAAVVVIVAGTVLARSGDVIAARTRLGGVWVGSVLLALATSLAAVRLRAHDLAVGNLFGSNALNMNLFAELDVAHAGAPVLSVADPAQALVAMLAVILMAVASGTLALRSKRVERAVEPGSLLLVLGYVMGIGLVFSRSARAAVGQP
jgi:cation:H+ antiporter